VTNDLAHPFDVCLLLRAHGEQWWLTTEVLPVVEELEPPCSLSDDQLGAAYAYLEVLCLDAARRARATDEAFAAMVAEPELGDRSLGAEARRYHAAVQTLRASLRGRTARLLRAVAIAPPQHQAAAL
jgi:hypothetical protein